MAYRTLRGEKRRSSRRLHIRRLLDLIELDDQELGRVDLPTRDHVRIGIGDSVYGQCSNKSMTTLPPLSLETENDNFLRSISLVRQLL